MKKDATSLFLLTVIFILFDQITKYFVLTLNEPIYLISDLVRFKFSGNTGIAFSLDLPFWIIIISNIILLGLIIFFAGKELNIGKLLSKFSVALILGGGAGNLIDRFVYGYVVDFIGIWKWPVFNLADLFITIGVLLIILFYGKIKRN